MKRNYFFASDSPDAYTNLATDEWLLDHVGQEDLVLFLYRNENAVIIGKNQNPFLECDLGRMERDGVQLVRRVSGGGAVYHDKGNLNFSFIGSSSRYDREVQLALVSEALGSLGIECEFSGRNDLVHQGRKFSGNAFAARKGRCQHHGTLLVSSDLEKLGQYLTVDPKKIRSKGIGSVRSRVCNLSEIEASLTVTSLSDALLCAFQAHFSPSEPYPFTPSDRKEIEAYRQRHASFDWKMGKTPRFDLEWRERFDWGGLQLLLSFSQGKIREVHAFSDAMDPTLCEYLESILTGLPMENEAISAALSTAQSPEIRSLAPFRFLN
ncbi:MAG: lipoate--protein ligase [Clostridia bacterium]|nr:lipoate--protein ligase [Clostridia bacterium]